MSWFGTALPDSNAEGLSQVQNPEFEITTPAGERLRRTISAVSGASIGISGPRGSGKTTLLWSNYQIGNTKPGVLSVFTSAPVEYDAREFVLHLFGSVCSRVIEKAVGRRELSTTTRRVDGRDRFFERSPLFGGRRTFTVTGVMLIYIGMILAYLKAQAAQATAAAQAAKTQVSFPWALVAAFDLNPGMLLLWGLVLLSIGFLVGPFIRSWDMRRDRQLSELMEDDPEEARNDVYKIWSSRFRRFLQLADDVVHPFAGNCRAIDCGFARSSHIDLARNWWTLTNFSPVPQWPTQNKTGNERSTQSTYRSM